MGEDLDMPVTIELGMWPTIGSMLHARSMAPEHVGAMVTSTSRLVVRATDGWVSAVTTRYVPIMPSGYGAYSIIDALMHSMHGVGVYVPGPTDDAIAYVLDEEGLQLSARDAVTRSSGVSQLIIADAVLAKSSEPDVDLAVLLSATPDYTSMVSGEVWVDERGPAFTRFVPSPEAEIEHNVFWGTLSQYDFKRRNGCIGMQLDRVMQKLVDVDSDEDMCGGGPLEVSDSDTE